MRLSPHPRNVQWPLPRDAITNLTRTSLYTSQQNMRLSPHPRNVQWPLPCDAITNLTRTSLYTSQQNMRLSPHPHAPLSPLWLYCRWHLKIWRQWRRSQAHHAHQGMYSSASHWLPPQYMHLQGHLRLLGWCGLSWSYTDTCSTKQESAYAELEATAKCSNLLYALTYCMLLV